MPKISPSARRALAEQRKAQILSAAATVFAAEGFERARISDIAREAGIAEGSIYNYFKNKSDLLVSIPRQAVQATLESMSTRMAAITDESSSPEQMLTTLVQNFIATIHQNAHIFRILLSALPTMSQSTREKYLNQVVLYGMTMLESYFKEQIDHGVFRRELNPSTLSRAFVGMFFPFVMFREVLQVEADADWQYDDLIESLVPLFLRGVLADAARVSKQRQKISVE